MTDSFAIKARPKGHVADRAIRLARDGFENFVANIGTYRDKAAHSQFSVTQYQPVELESMYRASWMGRKIIDIPTDDMTREWRTWEVDEGIIRAIHTVEEKFKLQERVAEAIRWGRLFGSSAIIVGGPALGNPEEPIDPKAIKPGSVTYLHVAFSPYLSIFEWEDDVAQPNFGQPRMYHYSPFHHRTGGNYLQIHASRVIPFSGAKLPPFAALAGNTWGDSTFQALEDTLFSAGSITATIASLIPESKVDVITIPNLANYLATPDGEEKLQRRFNLATMLKSVNNTLLLGDQETYEQKEFTYTGLDAIHLRLFQELSGAADIPATRFLSQSPAGLSSTGESDLRNYYDNIKAKQKVELRPRLTALDQILFASEGVKIPDGADYSFVPLWQMTPEQRSGIELQRAQAFDVIASTGIIKREVIGEAMISQLIENKTYPALEQRVKELGGADSPELIEEQPDPAEEAGRIAAAKLAPGAMSRARAPQSLRAKDAQARTLYLMRPVLNGHEILAWAKSQGFGITLTEDGLHVTIAYSKNAVDWMKIPPARETNLTVKGGARIVEQFNRATVLVFNDASLQRRWQQCRDAGASWDFESYQPHITIAYDSAIDLRNVQAFQGPIILGPERFAEVDLTWTPSTGA